ncbi:hypothetical protein Tco_0290973 [Tanacetum coccineum]
MFLKYSTGQIHPKKCRGKGSQGKKTTDTPVVDVDVSEESDSKPTRKRTASRRVVKKKVIIYAANNIIPDPDVTLELGKSISLTEAAEEEAARQFHATHARIVTESEPEPAKKKNGSRSTRGVVIQDTPSALKTKPATSKLKLKGVQSLTPEEQEATYVIVSPGVLDKSTVILATSSEGTSTKPGVENVTFEEKVILEWGSEQESENSKEDQGDDDEVYWIDSDEDEEKKDDTDDDKSIDLEMIDDEETDDEFVHGVKQVNDDEDEEMTNAEVEESRNGDEENIDAANTDVGKTEVVKDDAKKDELPPTSSSLSDTMDTEINSLLDIKIQYEVPHIQSPFVLRVPVFVISEPLVLLPVQETPSVVLATTLPPSSVSTIPPVPYKTTAPIPTPPITIDALTITTVVPESDALSAVQLRVAKLEKDVSKLKKIDHSAKALATLKHTADHIQKYSMKLAPESSKIQKPAIDLEQESEKSA